jgi:electron transport complex protein RnfG
MKETIRYATILGVICLCASGILALVNGFTAPKIAQQELNEEQAALKEVMPGCASFTPHPQADHTVYYSAYDASGKLAGFVLKSEQKGYSSTIVSLAGVNPKLEITAVKILSQNETPGLGNRICDPSFLAQFKGKSLGNYDEIKAITGASISSGAVIASVKSRLTELQEQLLQEIDHGK